MNTPSPCTPSVSAVDAPLARNDQDKQPSILVVENEFLTALSIKDNLLQSGYQVPAIASSGAEAIRLAAEMQPDLILMDIALDGTMTGIEAAEAIAHSHPHPPPVVYLSAYSDQQTIMAAKKTVPFGFIPKPCSRSSLVSTVEMALANHGGTVVRRDRERQAVLADVAQQATLLQEANAALQEALEQKESERRHLEQTVQTTIVKLISPSLHALEKSSLTESQRLHVQAIAGHLRYLAATRMSPSDGSLALLSATEMQVATFIKAGKSTKEIAQMLNVASSTINTHRDSIRKKMGIKNSKTNLKKTLQEML